MSLALPEALFFTGIDWAAETHAVCVMDAGGKIVAEFTIEHSADGIALLIRRLARYGTPGGMPVAIERPNGRLVDLLLEAGHPVVPVSPNAIKTWREGEVLSGAKSDAGDAAVIAEYLRLRAAQAQAAAPYSDETLALRTVVRTRGDLVEMRVAATNQLSALLEAHWPGAKAIFADVESPISLEFLTRYPTPAAAAHLGEKRMAAFCVKHGYSGRRTAAELLARLRAAPAGTAAKRSPRRSATPCSPPSASSRPERRGQEPRPLGRRPPRGAPGRRDLHVAAKVGSGQRRPGARRVGRLPPSLRRARLRRRPRRRARPVTSQSGKHRAVQFRWACNKRFRVAMTTFADNSRHASPWAAKIYSDARASGKDHPHAVRILARAWIRVIWPCWLEGIPYDPARHGAAAALARQTAQPIAA